MTITLLFLASFGCTIIGRALNKGISSMLDGKGSVGNAIYFIVTGVMSCIFFLISSGFHLNPSLYNLGYGAAYTVFCVVAMLIIIYIYRFFSVAIVSVVSSAGSLILSSLYGFIFWHESVTPIVILRLVCMILAIILVYFSNRHKEIHPAGENRAEGKAAKMNEAQVNADTKIKERSRVHKGVLLMVISLINSLLVTVVVKMFAEVAGSEECNSMFFFVNAYLIGIALLWLVFLYIKNPQKTKSGFRQFPLRILGTMCINCIFSDAGSIVSVVLLQLVAVSLYSPLTSAFGILSGVIVSFFRKEKMNGYLYIAVLFAVVAVVLP